MEMQLEKLSSFNESIYQSEMRGKNCVRVTSLLEASESA